MKLSLIQICEKCGHEVGEVLDERFRNWVWKSGGELKVRLKTLPLGEDTELLFELRMTLDERDEVAR
jgi:hypothetical protein